MNSINTGVVQRQHHCPVKTADPTVVLNPWDLRSSSGAVIGQQTVALVESRALTLTATAMLLTELLNRGPLKDFNKNVTILPYLRCEEFRNAARASGEHGLLIDLVILNIGASRLANGESGKIMNQLLEFCPQIPLMILADSEDPRDVFEAFRCGVRGYLHTGLNTDQVVEALRLVLSGGIYIPECILSDRGYNKEGTSSIGNGDPGGFRAKGFTDLTPRQLEVMGQLRRGLSNRLIAKELGLKESTVKVHVAKIFRKIRAENRTHAAFLAEQMDLSNQGSNGLKTRATDSNRR